MAYIAIDIPGARDLAKVLQDTATRAEIARRETVGALKLADLSSQAPLQLGLVQDGFARLAAGVANKADLAEQCDAVPVGPVVQPVAVAAVSDWGNGPWRTYVDGASNRDGSTIGEKPWAEREPRGIG